jgi:hypothetical protein
MLSATEASFPVAVKEAKKTSLLTTGHQYGKTRLVREHTEEGEKDWLLSIVCLRELEQEGKVVLFDGNFESQDFELA